MSEPNVESGFMAAMDRIGKREQDEHAKHEADEHAAFLALQN
jgi:hypothetical protein